ncbi:MAG: response regulator [Potamolinea sp.]
MNILLVDDDKILAESTAKLIECIGEHQVYITDEPEEVVQQCLSGKIDVVMMDVNLPGAEWEGKSISGADLSRLLKIHPDTANIPIVLVTAYALVNEQEMLLETSKAEVFCSKPILDFDELLKSLANLSKNSLINFLSLNIERYKQCPRLQF